MKKDSFLDIVNNDPQQFLEDSSQKEIISLLQRLDLQYHKKAQSEVSDTVYDFIKDYAKEMFPEDPYFEKVGAEENERNKVKLPVYMGSMDKIKADNSVLKTFKKKYTGNYVVSDKLDGISALIVYKNGKTSMYTRGNGIEGKDITVFMKHIKNIPKFKNEQNLIVRGELIMSIHNFEIYKNESNDDKLVNARNIVAGVINSKTPKLKLLNKIDFVAYSLIEPEKPPEEQIEFLKTKGFETVEYQILQDLDIDILSNLLENRKKKSRYEIDGLVVSDNKYYPIISGTNPDHSFAFKMTHQNNLAEVTVNDVEWNVTKNGLLKPVVLFDPVQLGGVSIKRSTGFNYEYIEKNGIGKGAKIQITRSGDVIPYIVKVLKKADKPSIPTKEYIVKGKDAVLINMEGDDVALKVLISFFKTIKIDKLSEKSLEKLQKNGFNTPVKILFIDQKSLQSILGNKNGENIYNILISIRNSINCIDLMKASNYFENFGTQKLKLIVEQLPHLTDFKQIPSEKELTSIKGISDKSAKYFLIGYERFLNFMNENKQVTCLSSKNIPKHNNENNNNVNKTLNNQVVIFTGFRDPELENKIIKLGGSISENMTNKVTILVTTDNTKVTGKIKKAEEKGVRIMSKSEFLHFI